MTSEAFTSVWGQVSGAEMIQRIVDGQVPPAPHAAHIGTRLTAVTPGRVEIEWRPGDAVLNPAGIVHGGYVSIVLDDAAGLACASVGDRFRPMLTQSLNVDFLRPANPGTRYLAVGTVLHRGRTRLVAEADVFDPEGRRVARATGNFVPNRAFDELMAELDAKASGETGGDDPTALGDGNLGGGNRGDGQV